MNNYSRMFVNPVCTIECGCADPTVWRGDDGVFRMFHTGAIENTLMTSPDLIRWTDTGKRLFDDVTISQLHEMRQEYGASNCIYAPTVVRNGEMWLMYLSLNEKCMVVLESEYADGPFAFHDGKPYTLISNGITGLDITNEDSCVAMETDGTWYLMWGSHGNLYRTTLTPNGLYLAYGHKFDHVAGNPKKPYKVYEGLYAYYRKGWWYLFAARGQYNSKERPYEVVVGRSRKLGGVFRSKWGLRMTWGCASLIMSPDDMTEYLGGAHTGEIFTDNDGNDYIVYQRQVADVEHLRHLFVQRIYWDKRGWPYFEDGVTHDVDDYPNFTN